MPADKELTKKITHRDIKKTAKNLTVTQKKICQSDDAWELAILCPGKKDTNEPELIGKYGSKNGWVHITRQGTMNGVQQFMDKEPAIIRKNSEYKIIPVDTQGRHVNIKSNKQFPVYIFAYDIYVKPKTQNIGSYGGGRYHNCTYYLGSGKCVHPIHGDRKKGGSGMCRYTAETEQKCPGYFGYDKFYSHSKGGRR